MAKKLNVLPTTNEPTEYRGRIFTVKPDRKTIFDRSRGGFERGSGGCSGSYGFISFIRSGKSA